MIYKRGGLRGTKGFFRLQHGEELGDSPHPCKN